MARRRVAAKREILPDAKYGDLTLARFINKLMQKGKRSTAEAIVYGSFSIIADKTGAHPLESFKTALNNVKPTVETKSRRIGGANYQVPIEVRANRKTALAMRWIIMYSKQRPEKTMAEKLAAELILASKREGPSIKKREDTHKMAEANKAFAHCRW